jgi:drug/metabolite transporter (DMT)-like permease
VIASGIKVISTCGFSFWSGQSLCGFGSFAIKSTIRNRIEIKKNIRFLALTAVLGITIFNTLIYFAGKTTSAVNLSLIISIPLFIVAISRSFREKVSNTKIIGILTILGVLILITKDLYNLCFK